MIRWQAIRSLAASMADRLLGLHLRPLFFLLLDPHFFFKRRAQLVRGLLELTQTLPHERPSSGSLRGPKIIRAITRMMTNSGMPMEPNIGTAPAGVHRH